MNASTLQVLATDQSVTAAIEAAIDSVAPTWPLDRMIAVNPYWGRRQQPFGEVGRHLAKLAGSTLSLPLAWYREAWQRGEITTAHLQQAAQEMQSPFTTGQLLQALETQGPAATPAPLLGDTLDRQRELRHQPAWCDTITHQVAQFCAAYFDREQADWRPDQAQGLYASWRAAMASDHSVALLMQSDWIGAKVATLAPDPEQQILLGLTQLGVPAAQQADYLQTVIMRLSGWAAWCAYLRWQAQLEGSDDRTIVDLLAIRLSWECLLDDGERSAGSTWSRWQSAWRQHLQDADNSPVQAQSIWQRAQEIAYQQQLLRTLSAPRPAAVAATPAVQAAFCIDVRSEVLRRHLEAGSDRLQTLGFAGFFGLPISYAPLGTDASRPQLPGLLAPALQITDSTGDSATDLSIAQQRRRSLRSVLGWRIFQSVPLSAFTLVETLGLSYLWQLVKRTLPSRAARESGDSWGLGDAAAQALRPTLDATVAGGVDGQSALAAAVLTAMGLRDGFARLVLLVGHGSQTRNNPHRAGLDCGACCGRAGDVNARALAGLLNNPAVRQRLRETGIDIPATTHFIAGLHNTTTDEVTLYDVADAPASHSGDIAAVETQLAAAEQAARSERAPALGLQALQHKPAALARAVRQRANDWAQTRPEWGLANNAAFIVAPRATTRNIDLQGRCFLHDYDADSDPDGTRLEQIMTAPMVVTHWINMQYYASTVDNHRYGSGNKTLHNVTGGRLGVFEGNGGDLRIGLPWQSVHDGRQWRHTPLRLTVVIQAPRGPIEDVIARHETVRQLVENRWLYLVRLDGTQTEMYRDGAWQDWATPA
ncbi:MAG: DUF2309 domain-containing protein [Halioglobus sp.]|nr:DUF2309 domain-containing protein [Halioglobus sp.]